MRKQIICILRSIKSARFKVRFNQDYPAIIPGGLFLIGNSILAALPLSHTLLYCLLAAGLLSFLLLRSKIALLMVSLGMLSSLSLQYYQACKSASNQMVLLTVVERTRYPVPGEVRLLAKIIALEQKFSAVSLSELQLRNENEQLVLCSGVDLPWENAQRLQRGQTVVASIDLKALVWTYNPLGYSTRMWRRQLQGKCRIKIVGQSLSKQSVESDLFRSALIGRAKSALGDNEATALLLAMTLGVQDGLSSRTDRAIRNLGLTHILVVSGYHFSLIFGGLVGFGYLLRRLGPGFLAPYGLKKLALFAAVLIMCAYATIVGGSVSTTRALCALICLVGGLLSERGYSMLNTIFVALVALSIIWPGTIFEVGTQFTFVALLAIVLALTISRLYAWPSWLTVPVLASLATQAVTLLWFNQLALWSIPANLILVPIVTFVICNLGLLGLALQIKFSGLGTVLLAWPWQIARWLIDFAWWLQSLSFGFYELTAWTSILLSALIFLLFGYLGLASLRWYLQTRRVYYYPDRLNCLSDAKYF